jgi:hypothetical protein
MPPEERVVVVVLSSDPPPIALSVILGAMDGGFVNDGEKVATVGSPVEEVGGITFPLEGVGPGELFGALEPNGASVDNTGESVLSI